MCILLLQLSSLLVEHAAPHIHDSNNKSVQIQMCSVAMVMCSVAMVMCSVAMVICSVAMVICVLLWYCKVHISSTCSTSHLVVAMMACLGPALYETAVWLHPIESFVPVKPNLVL